jgi:undecaprenyl-diphosphatase
MTPDRHPGHQHLLLFTSHAWAVAGAVGMYGAAAILLVLMAFDGGREVVQRVDDAWYDLMVAVRWGPLTALGEALNFLGSGWVLWPVRGAVALWLGVRNRWAALAAWVIATVGADLAIGLLKGAYDRPRPPDSLVLTTGFSFPSGHAMATAVTVVALVIVLLPPGPDRRIWEIRAGIAAFAMALSRTYLGAHWLSDVVAGALLGAATAVAVATVVSSLRGRRLGEPLPQN